MLSSWPKPMSVPNFLLLRSSPWHYRPPHWNTLLFWLVTTFSWFSSLPSKADVLLDSIFDSCLIPSLIPRFNYHLSAGNYQTPTSSLVISLSAGPLQPCPSYAVPPGCPKGTHRLPPNPVPPLTFPTPNVSIQKTGSHSRSVPLKAILHSTIIPASPPPQKRNTKSYSLVKNLKIQICVLPLKLLVLAHLLLPYTLPCPSCTSTPAFHAWKCSLAHPHLPH